MTDDARSPRIALAEIAAIAEVSEATVSRVMNRRYGVATATREAVERAMRELGYERRINGQLVVLLTPSLTNPFFARLGDRIQSELAPYGLRTIICPIDAGTADEREYVTLLAESGIAAAVFMSSSNTVRSSDKSPAEVLSGRGVPFVTINGNFEGVSSPTLSTDEGLAAQLSVDHLAGLGHRRIGMAAGPVGNIPADRRVDGFVRAMESLGVDDADVVRQFYTIDGGRHAAEQLIDLNVTAIIAGSDEMALGALQAAERAGLSVPHDLSLVGYDDNPLLDFTNPPITTIRPPIDRIAEQTGRSIVAMISNRPVQLTEMFFDPELHLRKSTGPVSSP
jgi:DNA-binding LacI/PurR family transcriptional regulator